MPDMNDNDSNFEKRLSWLARAIVYKPLPFIVSSVVLILLLAPHILKLEANYGVRIWFRTNDPLIKDLDALEQKFGSDEKVTIAVHSLTGIFTPKNVKVIQQLTEKVWLLPEVVRVDSLSNFNYTEATEEEMITRPFLDEEVEYTPQMLVKKKEIALTDPMIVDMFISRDAKTTVIYGCLKPNINGSPNYKHIMEKLNEMMVTYTGEGDLTYHFVGSAPVNEAYRVVSENDIIKMMPIIVSIMLIILFIVFRTLEGVFIPLVLVTIIIIMTMGTSALLGYKFDNMSSALPGILMAICMADTIHILATYYRGLYKGSPQKEAAIYSIRKNFVPTLTTSVTTMVGFFSLTQTELLPVQQLGWLAGIGTGLAWILTIFFICPILSLIPYRQLGFKSEKTLSDKFSETYVNWLDKYKTSIIVITTISALLFCYLGTQNRVDSDPLEHFSRSLKIAKDERFLIGKFNGLSGPQIVVDSGRENGAKEPIFLEKVEKFIHWLESKDEVNRVGSILEIIKHLNKKLNADRTEDYRIPDTEKQVAELLLLHSMGLPQGMDLNNQMSLDNRYIKLSIFWSLHDAVTSLRKIDEMYVKAKELDLSLVVTGKLTLYHRMTGYIVRTFFKSITIALVLISLLMLILLKSWRLGFISLLPNIIPLTFGAGLMTIIDRPVDIGTSLVISVCLGIAVDDTIHFLTHFRDELQKDQDTRRSIISVFITTSPALVFTTVILTLSFGVFIFADFIPNVNFGILCSIILTMALVIDLVYLPAILLRFKVRK
jgi:uncharacterized protein